MVNIIIFLNFVSLILKYTNFKFRGGGGGGYKLFYMFRFFSKETYTLYANILQVT